MNRSILIVICDFLLLSLLTFSSDVNHLASQNTPRQNVSLEMVTNPVVNANTDLASVMKLALQDERKSQSQLQQQLDTAHQQMSQQQMENLQLQQQYASAQTNISNLNQQMQNTAAASEQQSEARIAQARHESQLQSQLAELSQSNELAAAQQEQLVNKLQLAENERKAADQQAALMKQEIADARAENARLAEGVKLLATNSAALTAEIRNNRALAPNMIFSDFVSNRVAAAIVGQRTSFFNMDTARNKQTQTILVSDGTNTFAVCHVDATPLRLWDPGTDWNQLTGNLSFADAQVPIHSLAFDAQDPRMVMIPVTPDEARQLGSKVYRLSSDPYKFQDAVLIGADEGYYGQCSFQIDLNTPQYVKLNRNLLKGLFGQFNPSRGDFVFSGTGELLGIMVNNTYCLTLRDFASAATFAFGQNLPPTGETLARLYDYVFQMPQQLQ